MNTPDATHNSWSSYATWRVNLDVWDGYDWTEDRGNWSDVADLARFLEDQTDAHLTKFESLEGLAVDYARAFVSDVNFHEIAEAMVANVPGVILQDAGDAAAH